MGTWTSKKWVLASALFLYTWFFMLEKEGSGMGPEELEKYRTDLTEWVQENEEELRVVQMERREN